MTKEGKDAKDATPLFEYGDEEIQSLGREHKFIVTTDTQHPDIDHIVFESGHHYKLVQPKFFTLHKLLSDNDNSDHATLLYGLSVLHPVDESPAIDEDYLNKHSDLGFKLWSPLIRGLLLRRS